MFEIFILFGYFCGIAGKFITHNINYVLIFYFINVAMVGTDVVLYFRNSSLDKKKMESAASDAQ